MKKLLFAAVRHAPASSPAAEVIAAAFADYMARHPLPPKADQ